MSWSANRGTNSRPNRPGTPYAPGGTPAYQPPLWPIQDAGGRAEGGPTAPVVGAPVAPDGQQPRGVRTAITERARRTPSARRRPPAAARLLTVRLTGRDVAILRDVVRFGALTVQQIGQRHFGSVWTAYDRLKALADAGYLELVRVWHGAPGVYVATPEGTRVADAGLPPARVTASTLRHHLVVADVADRLLADHPGAAWLTERELRRDAMTASRERGTGRLFDGVPHVPDGVLMLADGRRVAVEVECSAKGSARYRAVLGWYAGTMAYDQVRWFVGDARLRERLTSLVRAERLDDLVTVGAPPEPSARSSAEADRGTRSARRPAS